MHRRVARRRRPRRCDARMTSHVWADSVLVYQWSFFDQRIPSVKSISVLGISLPTTAPLHKKQG